MRRKARNHNRANDGIPSEEKVQIVMDRYNRDPAYWLDQAWRNKRKRSESVKAKVLYQQAMAMLRKLGVHVTFTR
jgi:hypothetical protein